MIVSLDDVKTHLNMSLSGTTNDLELARFVDAATGIVEGVIGSVTPTTYTNEPHNGGSTSIITYHQPVISVQSVTEYTGNTVWSLTNQAVGASTDNYGYTLDDPLSGRITRRGSASYPVRFLGSQDDVLVTYTAGRLTVPSTVQLAALIIIDDLWSQTQRGTAPPIPGGPASDVAQPGTSGGIPSLALELLEGSGMARVPGIG